MKTIKTIVAATILSIGISASAQSDLEDFLGGLITVAVIGEVLSSGSSDNYYPDDNYYYDDDYYYYDDNDFSHVGEDYTYTGTEEEGTITYTKGEFAGDSFTGTFWKNGEFKSGILSFSDKESYVGSFDSSGEYMTGYYKYSDGSKDHIKDGVWGNP